MFKKNESKHNTKQAFYEDGLQNQCLQKTVYINELDVNENDDRLAETELNSFQEGRLGGADDSK